MSDDLSSDCPLDAAWAEVEAALPEGCLIFGVFRHGDLFSDDRRWEAEAEKAQHVSQRGFGSTPAAALRALAAKLREHVA